MLVVFPFEEKYFVDHDVQARYVGHPVVDRYRDFMSKADARRAFGCLDGRKCIALLPGSRRQEISRMLPAMVKAAGIIRKIIPSAVFYVAGVDNVERSVYDEIGNADGISLILGRTPELLCGSDFVITSSGTATVEAAYFRTPMVIIYKTGFLSYQIARRLVKLDAIGMVNIIAGRHIVPELIQEEASPEKIAEAALAILGNEERYRRMVADLQAVRDQLGPGDVGRQAWDAIREKIQIADDRGSL
jgi:lipid-A-disaccharide synthase